MEICRVKDIKYFFNEVKQMLKRNFNKNKTKQIDETEKKNWSSSKERWRLRGQLKYQWIYLSTDWKKRFYRNIFTVYWEMKLMQKENHERKTNKQIHTQKCMQTFLRCPFFVLIIRNRRESIENAAKFLQIQSPHRRLPIPTK